jgi:diaminopimelate decarboxylase
LEAGSASPGPAFIYLEPRFDDQWNKMRTALPGAFEILFSCKANPHPQVVQKMKRLGAGADVASLRELHLARDTGFSGEQISFVGPGKSPAELRAALEYGAHLVIESLPEAMTLNRLALEAGKSAGVSVRINPLEYLGHEGRTVSHPSSQFGVDEESFADFHRDFLSLKALRLEGIHVYTQSQLLSPHAISENFLRTMKMGSDLAKRHNFPLKRINFGGGFGIPYFSGQTELDLSEFKRRLKDGLSQMERDHGAIRYMAESGRYLAAACGFYVARVLYTKTSRGRLYAVTEGGINHYMAATGLDQMVKKNFPVFNLSKFGEEAREEITLAGPTCYFADLLARQTLLPKTEAGDLLCLGFAGAYGPSFSPSHFLSREPAEEIFLT